MTVGAYGRAPIAAGHGFCVNAFLVRQEWTIADAAAEHRRFVAVALAACLSDGRAVDRRRRIASRQDRRHVAILRVAIKTRRRLRAIVNRSRMKTLTVTGVRRGVEERTG